MTVLITGGSGFVGAHLRALLPDALAPGRDALDLTDPDSVHAWIAAHPPTRVLHLAAQTSPQHAERDPGLTQRVNVAGTRALVDALLAHAPRARLVAVSTCHAYGPPLRLPITEAHPLNPVGVYARSKAAAEAVVLAGVEQGLHAVIARPFNLTGPGHGPAFAPADWARQAAEGHRKILVGDIDVRRDYLDVRDAATGLWLLAERGLTGEAYNLCSGDAVPMRVVLAAVAPGCEPVRDPERLRNHPVPTLLGSWRKAGALGWNPTISLTQSLSDLRREIRGG